MQSYRGLLPVFTTAKLNPFLQFLVNVIAQSSTARTCTLTLEFFVSLFLMYWVCSRH